MAAPACIEQHIWRGDDTPALRWGFGPVSAPEIPAGAEFRLEVSWSVEAFALAVTGPLSGTIEASSPNAGLTVDLTTGTVSWTYTTEQSASIPRGARASYVLRCLYQGTTQVWVYGRLIVRDGARS